MVTEADKYIAQGCLIGTFALMSPTGHLVLNLLHLKLSDINIAFVLYILFALFLFFVGIILFAKGYSLLESEEINKWIQ